MARARSDRHHGGTLLLALLMASPASARATPPPDSEPVEPLDTSVAVDLASVLQRIDNASETWRRSCSAPDPHGLCVQIAPAEPSKARCAQPRLGRVTVRPRQTKRARRAHAALTAALHEAETAELPADPDQRARAIETLARGRMAQADHDLERYLAITMPKNLDFFVEEWKQGSGVPKWEAQYKAQDARRRRSTERFKKFVAAKTELARSLQERYAQIRGDDPNRWHTATALRVAWISQHMADELKTSIPKTLREPSLRDAYCEALAQHAEPLEREAQNSVDLCVAFATEHALTGPTVTACKALLKRYPAPNK
ncbi:MAG: hypothetical protein AAGF11_52855 [Myxococcota bacterium]